MIRVRYRGQLLKHNELNEIANNYILTKCKNKLNNKRTKKISWSMWFFYAALSLIIVFIGLYIIFR